MASSTPRQRRLHALPPPARRLDDICGVDARASKPHARRRARRATFWATMAARAPDDERRAERISPLTAPL
eukprot:8866226-Alexandrium_andersonii.AAC.1